MDPSVHTDVRKYKKSNVYTRTGDDGTTGILKGTRVKKTDKIIKVLGAVDLLNAHVGMVRSLLTTTTCTVDSATFVDECDLLFTIQNRLFDMGALIASKFTTTCTTSFGSLINTLESEIDRMEDSLPKLTKFIIPGCDTIDASIHMCRAITRQTEIKFLGYLDTLESFEFIVDAVDYSKILNRLSDYFFVLTRYTAFNRGLTQCEYVKGQ